MLMSS